MRKDYSIQSKITLFFGIDEFKKAGDYNNFRNLILSNTNRINDKGVDTIKVAFTSFLREDVKENKTSSGRTIYPIYLPNLQLETIKKLFAGFWEKRKANQTAILCCFGNQRALAYLYSTMSNYSQVCEKSPTEVQEQKSNELNKLESILFSNLIDKTIIKFANYVEDVNWLVLEPAVMGRKIKLSDSPDGVNFFSHFVELGVFVNTLELNTEINVVPRTTL